ncbi:hypothetical protein XENTR_v10012718 [Xenopus tropicalis]|nr:hypothetical protein XENTR_v10012718 [Xenopus tropicalis]
MQQLNSVYPSTEQSVPHFCLTPAAVPYSFTQFIFLCSKHFYNHSFDIPDISFQAADTLLSQNRLCFACPFWQKLKQLVTLTDLHPLADFQLLNHRAIERVDSKDSVPVRSE